MWSTTYSPIIAVAMALEVIRKGKEKDIGEGKLDSWTIANKKLFMDLAFHEKLNGKIVRVKPLTRWMRNVVKAFKEQLFAWFMV